MNNVRSTLVILGVSFVLLSANQAWCATSIEGDVTSSTFTSSGPVAISTLTVTYVPGSPAWLNNGKILKILEFTDTGADVVTSATSFSDTNLTSGSITPTSATSDIWIVVIQGVRVDYTNTTSPAVCDMRLLRDSTTLRTWTNAAVGRASPAITTSAFVQFPFVGAFLDSSHSGSARTYKTQIESNGTGTCRSNSSAFGSYLYVIEYQPKT